MYRSTVNYLQGNVSVRVESPFPERVLNLCAVHDVPFWDLKWLDAVTFTVSTTRRGLRRLRQVVGAECTVTVCRESGAPHFLRKFRRRYALWCGLAAFVLLLFGGNLFIWEFRVTGNQTVPDETILRALEDYGITVGSPGMHIDQENLRNHVLLELSDLSWLVVNVKGCVGHVQVVERQRPPEIVDDTDTTNVVASRPGLVTKVEALDGKAQVAAGSTVTEGQLLISGVVDSQRTGVRFLHGMGNVWARTWYDLSVMVPLSIDGHSAVERKTTRIALDFGKHRIKIYGKGSMLGTDCDKIIHYSGVSLPGGLRLPITVVKEETVRYTDMPVQRAAADARAEGEALLLRLLEEQMTDTGTVTQTRFAAAEKNGCLLVTLKAECLEQIGRQVHITQD